MNVDRYAFVRFCVVLDVQNFVYGNNFLTEWRTLAFEEMISRG